MARRGHEVDAEALDVVDRIVQRDDLQLARRCRSRRPPRGWRANGPGCAWISPSSFRPTSRNRRSDQAARACRPASSAYSAEITRSPRAAAASSNFLPMRTACLPRALAAEDAAAVVHRDGARTAGVATRAIAPVGTRLRRRPRIPPVRRNRIREGRDSPPQAWPRSCGYALVTVPARSVFCRILNMSAVRPRVGKIEALVDHRENRR